MGNFFRWVSSTRENDKAYDLVILHNLAFQQHIPTKWIPQDKENHAEKKKKKTSRNLWAHKLNTISAPLIFYRNSLASALCNEATSRESSDPTPCLISGPLGSGLVPLKAQKWRWQQQSSSPNPCRTHQSSPQWDSARAVGGKGRPRNIPSTLLTHIKI